MADLAPTTDAQASDAAPAPDQAEEVRRWIDRIERAERDPRRHAWEARCRKVMRRYKDEREGNEGRQARRFALLWANQETLKPVVYARTPRPEVNRRFRDEDPIGRIASEVLERALTYALDAQDFDAVLKLCRDDFLLYARGQAWVRYVPHMRAAKTPVTPISLRHPGNGEAAIRDLREQAASPGGPRLFSSLREPQAGMTGEGGGDTAFEGPEISEESTAWQDAAGRVHDTADVRHDAETGPHIVEDVLDYEEVVADHLHYDDFIHPPVRTWAELPWAARRAFMTREELLDRFGEKTGKAVPLDWTQDREAGGASTLAGDEDPEAKAAVYEVWDRRSRTVLWLSKGWPQGYLDRRDDPLGLTGFFPFPRPMQGTTGTDTVIPIPDYVFYQDQAEEIDELTARIGRLEKGLKCMGFYAGASGLDLSEMFAEGENRLVPIADWSTLKGDGGVAGLIEWWPLDQVVGALEAMVKMRAQLIQDVYQITGIADILRGASDPDETATAQGLKANWGAVRVRDKQKEIARFARDLIRLMGQVIAARFSTGVLKQMTDMPLFDGLAQKAALLQQITLQQQQASQMAGPPAPALQSHVPPGGPGATGPAGGATPAHPATLAPHPAAPQPLIPFELQRKLANPTWEEVGALLQDEAARQFRIEVETDSTIEPDEQAAKAAATEFIGALGQYISSTLPAVQAAPQLTPLIAETMKYLTRHYRAGRELEDIIDRIADSLAEGPPPAHDSPHENPQAGAQAASGAAQMLASQAKMAMAQVAQQKESREAFTDAQRLQLEQQKAQLDAWSAQNSPRRAFIDFAGRR